MVSISEYRAKMSEMGFDIPMEMLIYGAMESGLLERGESYEQLKEKYGEANEVYMKVRGLLDKITKNEGDIHSHRIEAFSLLEKSTERIKEKTGIEMTLDFTNNVVSVKSIGDTGASQ
ncbi:MAG: hypothetical protein WC584_03345 [Candidatus Pacearchaeota archaeon]